MYEIVSKYFQQYISRQKTSSTSVIKGPAVHQQQRSIGTTVGRGPAVHQLAEDQQYISH